MRQRDLKFTFVVGEGKLAFDVVEFELEEALCEPFRLNLKLASDKNAIDFKQVLDQPGTFTLWQDGRPARYVHGIVSHFTQGSSGFRRTRYELLLEPQLARLELCCNWRIFQEKSVPEILQALLKEHRVLDYEQRIYHEHLPREYCVQAGDSDHYLHDRLAFEEGLVYYFRFDEHRHTLVCSDRLYVQERIAGGPVLFSAQPEGDNPQPVLHSFRYSENVRTARQTQRDYSFKRPTYDQEHHLAGEALEHQTCARSTAVGKECWNAVMGKDTDTVLPMWTARSMSVGFHSWHSASGCKNVHGKETTWTKTSTTFLVLL
ncbi:VgrG protein [Pseudomonas aeruginosa PA38182]|nr:VgrG protein [Pseudomonas aeruginosa PA38182]